METIEAVVDEGGVLRGLPFAAGTLVKVTPKAEKPEITQEQWVAKLRRSYGAPAHTDVEVPEDYPPSEIEPL